MVKNCRQIAAGQFKARCLALLDEVAQTGQPLVVTKRGKPVARVIPAEEADVNDLHGSVLRQGDLISPVGGKWDAER